MCGKTWKLKSPPNNNPNNFPIIPKIAPKTPAIAPNIPAITPMAAPNNPATKPKIPPAIPIQIGKVKTITIISNTEEADLDII